jgi:uncharacterized protein (TIGR03086 family)
MTGMETAMFDMRPAAAEVARVVAGIRDDQLDDPTPCEGTSVAGLLDHLVGLTYAFRCSAEKTPVPDQGSASPDALVPDWRTRLAGQLPALAEAWRSPAAWDGEASAGGVTMPAPAMAAVALDELVIHGWDLAVATGQPYSVSDADAAACTSFAGAVGESPEERAGLYGPRVPVPDDAPALDRLLGLTGRDPGWRP